MLRADRWRRSHQGRKGCGKYSRASMGRLQSFHARPVSPHARTRTISLDSSLGVRWASPYVIARRRGRRHLHRTHHACAPRQDTGRCGGRCQGTQRGAMRVGNLPYWRTCCAFRRGDCFASLAMTNHSPRQGAKPSPKLIRLEPLVGRLPTKDGRSRSGGNDPASACPRKGVVLTERRLAG